MSRQSICQGSQSVKAVNLSRQSICQGSQSVNAVKLSRQSRQSSCKGGQGNHSSKAAMTVKLSRKKSFPSRQAVMAVNRIYSTHLYLFVVALLGIKG